MTWVRSVLWVGALGCAAFACGRDRSSDDHAAGENGAPNAARSGDAGRTATSGTGSSLPGGGTAGTAVDAGGRPPMPNAGAGGVAVAGANGVAGGSEMPTGGSTTQAGEGGQGGDDESAGRSAAGGGAGKGSSNGGAGSAAGTPAEVFDPDLPVPTHDCRTDTSKDCVSLAGTFEGTPIDLFTESEKCGAGGVHSGKWVIGCDHVGINSADVHVVLDVPIIRPGSFSASMQPGDAAFADFQFYAVGFNKTVALFAGNLVSAQIAGTVVADDSSPTYPYRVVSGTFHGVWGTPETSCLSVGSTACATAELNVTFSSRTQYGTCFAATDCTLPETCDMVGLYCRDPN